MQPAFLFDLYGTLVRAGSATWIARSARLLGVSPEELRAAAGQHFRARELGHMRTPDEAVTATLRSLGRTVDDALLRELVELRWSFFHSIELFADTLPALDRLRELGHPLALASNCSAETSVALERLDLGPRFDALVLSCDLGVAKPDPAFYLHACQLLGVEPRGCVFVGDGENDEHAGARALGMTTVMIHRPGLRQRQAETDHTIVALEELFQALSLD
jgi:putative hydrolase of the HAD superfamily